jgi:uncharacterized protein (DUF952 family)
MLIYKVFRKYEWSQMQQAGETAGAPVDLTDGYIHFSTAGQVKATLAKHFAGEEGLVLLACDASRLDPCLRWELSRGGMLFPHLYRSLRMEDVSWVRPIGTSDSGHEAGTLE